MAECTDRLDLAHVRHLRAPKGLRAPKDRRAPPNRLAQRLDPVDA